MKVPFNLVSLKSLQRLSLVALFLVMSVAVVRPIDASAQDNTYTIYFDNSLSNWNSVYAYAYGGTGGNDFLGNWPGTKMTLDTDHNLYKLVIETDKNLSDTNVIFTNNSGSQTGDGVTIRDKGIYDANGFTGRYFSASAIDDVSANTISITARGGVLYVNSPVDGHITIVRADGMTTVRPVYTGVNIIDDLQRGFYIINRTKVIL